MQWVSEFNNIFEINYNTIGLRQDVNFHGWKLVICEDIKQLEEIDDMVYNYYIEDFIVEKPNGDEIHIHTTEADNIYFVPDFYSYISSLYDIDEFNNEESGAIVLDMAKLRDLDALFIMEMRNNELSATMDKIEKLIDNKSVICTHDRNSILREFIVTNIAGGIKLNSVHFEVLLMNQIRSDVDDIEMPNWAIPNAGYQILALRKSLSNNRSITLRLQSDKISNALMSPQNRYLHKPAMVDLFYMEQPQEYLNNDIVSYENLPESDIDKSIIQPISFENPKIRVGREVKKRRL
jgi:hypothetical protein